MIGKLPWWLKSKTVWFSVATAAGILLGAETIDRTVIGAVLGSLGTILSGRHAQQKSIVQATKAETAAKLLLERLPGIVKTLKQ